MNSIAESAQKRLSTSEFAQLASFSKREFGLNLSENKMPLVFSRLSKRLEERKVANFSEYLKILNAQNEHAERQELVSALTTNVTSFFREAHHFETLKNRLYELRHHIEKGKRVRVWSAGCSSGQEPYSIAATILSVYPDARKLDIKVLATDIDPKIVSKAKSGLFRQEKKVEIPESLARHLKPSTVNPEFDEADDVLKNLITFGELNLISDWPFSGPFDVIFCRNVAIYFDQDTQRRLWKRFSDLLTDEGIIFIGHSERICGPALGCLQGIGITSYQRRSKLADQKILGD
jgi:chemotaxis protein methyltransferase CheR